MKEMVNDGNSSYKSIINDLSIPHKSCTIHIMQNLMKSTGKEVKKLEKYENIRI